MSAERATALDLDRQGVTPGAPEADRDSAPDAGDMRKRDRTRERVRRYRAGKKQAAVVEFIRTDASLFLHPDRLSQKAGAPKQHLRRMAIKELVDNALDAAPTATLTKVDNDTFVIEDAGPGIAPRKVVELFSVVRPMMSTKLIRRPTRGMVGNGLRVATGAAFASGGSIIVESRKIRQVLGFDRTTGETIVAEKGECDVTTGTRVTIRFGDALPYDLDATLWGDTAIRLAGPAAKPLLTHPDWYSAPAFKELIEAARGTAQDVASLFGVDLARCNAAATATEPAHSEGRERYIDPDGPVDQLSLDLLRRHAPKPPKLLPLARDAFMADAYRMEQGEVLFGAACVPAIVQVWATEQKHRPNNVELLINRTPTVAEMSLSTGGDALLRGCGLWRDLGPVPKPKGGGYEVVMSITTPVIELVTDGKTPNLTPFGKMLGAALGPALRKAHNPQKRGASIKDAAYAVMTEAYLKASAGGTLPANARQIMYAARPFILETTGIKKLKTAYFTQTLLPGYLEENPQTTKDWDVVYDARGHLVEPHTGHSIPLGTLAVREYLQRRPRASDALIATEAGLHATAGPGDRYGTVLFVEKEGFNPLLRAARISDRFDCAVMSTKGMSVVAARALVDRLSSAGIKILVAHDLDLAGMRIFGTLGTDSRRYQFKHPPDIRRIGLTLDQAAEMGLQDEEQVVEGDHEKLLVSLRRYGIPREEIRYITGGRRVELNAMASDQFIAWLESALVEHGVEKVIPPADMLEQRARQIIGMKAIQDEVERLQQQADEHGAEADLPGDLTERIRRAFARDPAIPWEDALAQALDEGFGR